MRVLLFTGKGGVGKTTLAAATAAQLASQGRKTLVISTDPAHSLSDAFGVRLGAEPTEVSELDVTVHAAQLSSRGLVDESWQELRARLRAALSGFGVDELDAEELTVVPGMDELLALTEVRRLADTGSWDALIVDCGPTAETLRLLSLPEAISGYVQRMYRGTPAGGAAPAVAEAIGQLASHVAGLRDWLTDARTTTVRLVFTPERLVVSETRRTLTALALRGIQVDGVIANRLAPKVRRWRGGAANWLRIRRSEQDKVLAGLAGTGIAEPRTVAHRAAEPVGMQAILGIATELYGATDPLCGHNTFRGPLLRVEDDPSGHRLHLALPITDDTDVDLARVDDDLAVTVDGMRRLIALPALLRNRVVTGAEVDADGLTVFLSKDGARR
ncbi:arsenite efflux ATP-binding protein ArsA [Tamaricihabitans halophyticus]|uniref:Arsenite efflux ATP-binding protein ArsA n=1 Tax=Tamaricihabitans halophyticus TaxID=1262583 RepID=A0A4V2SUM7_9PSEU|nr:ArsA family ATPase [Tamaricihabitans halophyticus]TCP55116.1 arsenite efflux ATP-binding protein ArsA [Tamaricihabitans halophyticus]